LVNQDKEYTSSRNGGQTDRQTTLWRQ